MAAVRNVDSNSLGYDGRSIGDEVNASSIQRPVLRLHRSDASHAACAPVLPFQRVERRRRMLARIHGDEERTARPLWRQRQQYDHQDAFKGPAGGRVDIRDPSEQRQNAHLAQDTGPTQEGRQANATHFGCPLNGLPVVHISNHPVVHLLIYPVVHL